MNSDLSGPGGGYMPTTIRRRLYANKTLNAVSRSDPLQGSDKNIFNKYQSPSSKTTQVLVTGFQTQVDLDTPFVSKLRSYFKLEEDTYL